MSKSVQEFIEAAATLGSAVQAEFPGLWAADDVPAALWRRMAAAGLFGLSAPVASGGGGLAVGEVARVGRAFNRAAGVQGLGSVWLSHNLMADWILGHFADAKQRAEWLPRVAGGEATLAFAVSEPGAGAHPKRLTTHADVIDGGFRLNGRKAYVTNGPIAAVFAIVAVISESSDGLKAYGAFLVPRETPGLTVGQSEHVDFLKPSGHATLLLENVEVPTAARLGDAPDIYPSMVRPLRDHEDAPGAWARLGSYERLAGAFAGGEAHTALAGGLAARLSAVEAMLERDGTDDLLAVRAILSDVGRLVDEAVDADPEALGEGDRALAADLARIQGVARYAVDARFAELGRRIAQLP